MIPTFPEFSPIELDQKTEVDAVLAQLQPQASEYTFTNLFGWALVSEYQLARFDDGLLVRKSSGSATSFLQPLAPGDGRAAVETCLAYLRELGAVPQIERVGEDFLARTTMDGLAVREERDNFDYIYSVQELIELRGERFHDKKNLLNQFEKRYTYRYLPMTPEIVRRCLEFQHAWCEERDCERHIGLFREHCATYRMLRHFSSLNLRGGAIEIDGEIVTLTLGEPLNADTFVIHVEKAKGGVSGLYQAINREFLAHAAADFSFVNREQDLGVPGLRKAKLSYNPVRLVKKYAIGVVSGK